MNLARFDLVTLGLFVAVARLGSISAGARQSHLAVAAASKRISDLEAAVGSPLLYRHAAGVELTEAGQACFRHAVGILQDVERMAGALSDFAAGTRGLVRVWANTSSITQFLADDLAAFMLANPAIRIALEEQDSGDIVAALRENRADLGIFAAGTPCEGLQSFDYREDDLALVTPRGHPLAGRKQARFAEAADFDFVSLPRAPRWPRSCWKKASAWAGRCACASRCAASRRSAAWWPRGSGWACCRALPRRRMSPACRARASRWCRWTTTGRIAACWWAYATPMR